jgi:hypothetical protein
VPPLGGLEQARPRVAGPRERPLLVPEQLTLEERLRQGRAVQRDEGPRGAVRSPMNRGREHLLPDARLPEQQEADGATGSQERFVIDPPEHRVLHDDPVVLDGPLRGREGTVGGQGSPQGRPSSADPDVLTRTHLEPFPGHPVHGRRGPSSRVFITSVDEGSPGPNQIDHVDGVADSQLGVPGRDGGVMDAHIVGRVAADRDSTGRGQWIEGDRLRCQDDELQGHRLRCYTKGPPLFISGETN